MRHGSAPGGRDLDAHDAAGLVNAPRAPGAPFGWAIVYVARTPRGWQPWFEWLPNAPASRLLPTR